MSGPSVQILVASNRLPTEGIRHFFQPRSNCLPTHGFLGSNCWKHKPSNWFPPITPLLAREGLRWRYALGALCRALILRHGNFTEGNS